MQPFLLLLVLLFTAYAQEQEVNVDGTAASQSYADIVESSPGHCAEWTGASCDWEPNLKPLHVTFFHKENITVFAYQQSPVGEYYNESSSSKKKVKSMKSQAMFGKFINFSPDSVNVYWDGGILNGLVYSCTLEPFGSSGTATYPTHKFVVTPSDNKNKVLQRWTVKAGESLHYYDPFNGDYAKAKKALKDDTKLSYYHMQLLNKKFAEQYKAFTNTDWLGLYGQRHAPRYHMWRADYFGQTHIVTSTSTSFIEAPAENEIARGLSGYGPRPDELSRVRKHRGQKAIKTMTLKVLSCAPRVFEIEDFLSPYEISHVLKIAHESTDFRSSSVSASEASDSADDSNVRTSTNTWIDRRKDIVIDAIYQRAADVLQIKEALLRWRRKTEIPEVPPDESQLSIAESLQLVHYSVGQKYQPHHDFFMPPLVHGQPARFATLLLYLNTVTAGGETTFPVWRNAHTNEPLKVTPTPGKAVLFYNMLPDGNYDQYSLHEAAPVLQGEKYLTNLWVWDPYMDHDKGRS